MFLLPLYHFRKKNFEEQQFKKNVETSSKTISSPKDFHDKGYCIQAIIERTENCEEMDKYNGYACFCRLNKNFLYYKSQTFV